MSSQRSKPGTKSKSNPRASQLKMQPSLYKQVIDRLAPKTSLARSPNKSDDDATVVSAEDSPRLKPIIKGPSKERTIAINQGIAMQRADDRGKKTNYLYGNVKCPEESSGYIGEFARWCKAGPNEEINGWMTDPTKSDYTVVPNMSNVYDFMVMHFVA